MEIRRAVCIASLSCAFAGFSASADTLAEPDRTGAEIGLLRITCVSGSGVGSDRFRGVVVDTAAAGIRYDVILTAAHGFPRNVARALERCTVLGPNEREYAVDAIWRPEARGRGSIDDWAVIATDRRVRGRIERQSVRILPPAARVEPNTGDTAVRLPLLFFGAEHACALAPPGSAGVELDAGLFGHTCRAWPGHSGSPILADDDGDIFVVGIHVGSRWIFERQSSFKIGRFVDAAILEAIQSAIVWGVNAR